MNVFVRVAPESKLRAHLAAAVIARLAEEVGSVTLLVSQGIGDYLVAGPHAEYLDWQRSIYLPAEDFHRESKHEAAIAAESDWLLIVDDDQLPLYKDWIGYAVSLTKRYPDYAAIAGWSVTHEVPRPESLIAESDSIGCPMIVRRDALLDATSEPIDNPQRADTILTQRLQKHGKTGIARNWRYNHLGMAYSQVVPAHWMPECPV